MDQTANANFLRILPLIGNGLFRACAAVALFFALIVSPALAATVSYTMQTGNFNSLQTEKNNNPPYAGTFNNGATELGNYANGGSFNNTPGAAAFQTFNTTGNGNTGAVRALQVGDTFTITAFTSANPSAGGYLGISFRDSTSYANFFAATDSATEARFQLDNTGGWKVYSGGSPRDSSLGANADRAFVIKVTSATTFDAQIGGTWYYNNTMAAGGGTIDSFAIYTYGDSNQNSFWKNASLSDTGTVELGYALGGGNTFTPGAISDGLAATSTSSASVNAVFVGGDAGSQVNLASSNSYTGLTTVNANARLEVQNAGALGGTANGTTVSSGGAISLYQATGGITVANESLALNGVGVSGANGALRNTGGTNAWNGTISLGANSRINADTTGTSGSLTIGGNVGAGNNVLFIGAIGGSGANTGGNITINGAISGSGNTQDSTVTSVYKDGAGVLTLGGVNTYSGDTRIAQGNLTVSGSGTLGNGTSDVYIASGASLSVNTSMTIASMREWGNTNGGTAAIGAGATLTVAGDNWTGYMNSIGGAGNLVKSGTGTMNLYGTQSYGGTTAVSGGKLSTGVALASSGVTISGGNFETTAANILSDTASVTLNSGTYNLGGDDTIGALSGTGGAINLGGNRLTTTVAASTSSYSGGVISGVGGGLTKAGSGTLSLGGTHSYTGNTAVSVGELRLVGAILSTSSSVSVSSGAKLGGYGTVGALGGAGSIDPGNSPGILTTTQVDPSGGLDFNVEFTGLAPVFNTPNSSVNDLVRITGTTPFSQSLNGANIINVYFSGDALYTGGAAKQIKGGFFTDQNVNFFSSISGATYNYYFAMSGGGTIYNGTEYVTQAQYEATKGFNLTITANTFAQSASFDGTTTINGQIVQIDVIPEPSTYALLALGGAALGIRAFRRRFRR
ncbi:MAG: toxins and related Ca2+-binding domain [Verrucomicrobiota bacterium]